MRLVDTHCHLNDSEAFPDPGLEVEAARDAGVDRMIVVGIEPAQWRPTLDLARALPGVYAAIGWHPNSAAAYNRSSLPELESMLQDPRVVALGEIGLDYHWDFATRAQQDACFRDQLELAARLEKPVVIHCREAYDDLLAILENSARVRLHFHCFSGSSTDAKRALALGGYLGVDGPVTYKKSDGLRELLATVPKDRVLLETDAPWLAPHPRRGKLNRPAYLPLILSAVAAVWNLPEESVAEISTANAVRFYGLTEA